MRDEDRDDGDAARSGVVTELSESDAEDVFHVVNAAAEAYAGRIPEESDTDPYMPLDELRSEMREMQCFGYVEGRLVGVVGLQERQEASLIRHLYVLPDHQGRGVGTRLLQSVVERAESDTLLVGTWKAATWAIEFYERNGFENLGSDEALLAEHWAIPDHQRRASVVLRRDPAD